MRDHQRNETLIGQQLYSQALRWSIEGTTHINSGQCMPTFVTRIIDMSCVKMPDDIQLIKVENDKVGNTEENGCPVPQIKRVEFGNLAVRGSHSL